jgi:hypothetical protein
MYAAELNWLIVFDQMLIVPPENSLPDGVMPRLGLGIHEFGSAGSACMDRDSWTPRPRLGVTIEWVAKVEFRNPGAAR